MTAQAMQGEFVPAATPAPRSAPVDSDRGRLRAVPAGDVMLTGGFWAERQQVNGSASIGHCEAWMERLGWIQNFDRTAAGDAGPRSGREFADSEIYKLLEAMAWEFGRTGDPRLEERFTALARRVLAAQQPDGYLGTRFGGPGQPQRYSDLEWGHELYCAGHFIQAAVARARTASIDDPLVAGAIRLADHIVDEFGETGRDAVCGHPEIEPALVELARLTGDARYLRQAELFVGRRGRGLLDGSEAESSYFQDDVPVRDATTLRGHAVRALYLSAGAIDVAVERDDRVLLDAVRAQWDATLARRTYLTGGMGSRHDWEAFGDDFELPSDRAYSETCAGVASVMVAWRLLLATGDVRHGDQIERALYNVVATSPDADGTAFFYVNPLQRRVPGSETDPDAVSPRAASSQRASWFAVSCCPTNVARTLASLGGYFATVDADGLQLLQYADADIDTVLADGRVVRLRVRTEYPVNGTVSVEVLAAPEGPWSLKFRVPGWGDGAALTGSGRHQIEGALAEVRELKTGDVVALHLPVAPRLTLPDPRIDALRGSAAVEAGPVVYCLESLDVDEPRAAAGDPLDGLRLLSHAGLATDGDTVRATFRLADPAQSVWPYAGDSFPTEDRTSEFRLIPYHRWAERGPGTMRVWLPLEGRP